MISDETVVRDDDFQIDIAESGFGEHYGKLPADTRVAALRDAGGAVGFIEITKFGNFGVGPQVVIEVVVDDDDLAAGLQNAAHLARGGDRIGKVFENQTGHHEIESVVLEGNAEDRPFKQRADG